MSDETVFYVLGLTLTAVALVVSFIGVRSHRFPPSRPVLIGGIALFCVLIGGTAAFAWLSAEEEQSHRNEEIAAGELPSPAEVVEEYAAGASESEQEEEGATPPEEGEGGEQTASVDPEAIFEEEGCAGCHALDAAGSTGQIGPDLDATLADQDVAFIEESIVDPEAEIAEGFGPIMPDDFEEQLTPEELDALVQYLAESVGARG
jgi:mono/diheme cytochrome c family protein